jgi:NTE family protein
MAFVSFALRRLPSAGRRPPTTKRVCMSDRLPEATLADVDVFSDLGPAERASLSAELERLHVARGEVLVRQGELADALYVVVSGRFAVTVEGREDAVAEIGPGQPIGEIAFLAGGRRTATVYALRDSLVLKLGRSAFETLSERNPAIWRAMTVTLARRLAESNVGRAHTPDPRPRTIAVVQAGPAPVPALFLERLRATFAATNRTTLVDREVAAGVLDRAAITSPEATAALNALEGTHDYVLYVTDPGPTEWSEKAIRQADLVLLVGRHEAAWSGNVVLTDLERLAMRVHGAASTRLVLLHGTRGEIAGTARWLADRPVSMHHHVALDRIGDIERLVRFVDRRALGLVACGGGAYCAAHIGIYAAFLEAGVEFDIMGGTSGGAAMTAAFALGGDPEAIDRGVHEIFVTNRAMRRYTWPRYGLLDHHHFDEQLRRHYGTGAIEDLWIPYFAVSTNLSTHALERHRRGELWAAVRASGAIPGLLPPYFTSHGQMLVDGALLDNVPIRVMSEIKTGPNVVVSFASPRDERFAIDYGALPSRGHLLRAVCNPFARGQLPVAPGPGSVLMRAMMANRHGFERHLGDDDLLLSPPFPADMGILDWHRHRELMDLARAWTKMRIEELGAEAQLLLRS